MQEKLESSHNFVRQTKGHAIKRQKTFHDTKLSFENFEAGDKGYVYFPVKKPGCSSKLTSFWRGPYVLFQKNIQMFLKKLIVENRILIKLYSC